MATITRGQTDNYIAALKTALESYEATFAGAKADLYRETPGVIRVRIVDSRFAGMSRSDRHDEIWNFLLERVGEDAMQEVYVLVLLPPKDVATSFANYEFENPA